VRCQDQPLTMLLREDDHGVLAIGQPSHAWLSGQLARAWGNERFGTVEPYEEVCLAAEQHDVGWAKRELEPIFNPDTGLPRSFMQMPLDIRLRVFRDGPRELLSQSRYAALLVSMHGWRLYRHVDQERMSPSDAERVRRFLEDRERFQRQLVGALRRDAATAPAAGDDLIERNSMLIWTWDYLSLGLCLNWPEATARRAPTVDGAVDLELRHGLGPLRLALAPWPFAAPSLTVHCEGRRLAGRARSEQQMREALAAASWETLRFELEPG
jgi:Protein of unknown function (DUF3891)